MSVDYKQVNCDLNTQLSLSQEHLSSAAKRKIPEQALLSFNQNQCIYCLTTKETKKSSDALASRSFIMLLQPKETLLNQNQPGQNFFSQQEIDRIFDKQFVPYVDVKSISEELCHLSLQSVSVDDMEMDELSMEDIKKIWEDKVKAVTDKVKAVTDKVKAVMDKVKAVMPMPLNYELPYNEWLHQLLKDKLTDLNFAVYQRDKTNPRSLGPLSEYIFCKSDILLYHTQKVESESVVALELSFNDLSLEPQTTPRYGSCDICASVTELKVEPPDSFEAAINETYYNMFGEAVKLTVNALSKGKLVKTATIYGILVTIHQNKEACLLKLTIDYFNRACTFERSTATAPFVDLLNGIIEVLLQ